jgi:type II restriction enzyme
LYKPIQVAEILYRDRISDEINFEDIETFRLPSRKWRDVISDLLVKSTSSSSAKYQDALFTETEMPIEQLAALSKINKDTKGGVEAYIYRCFKGRFNKMVAALDYCYEHNEADFRVKDFLKIFNTTKELKRSVDKIYEIIVYALFSALVDCLNIQITLKANESKIALLKEFEDFAKLVIGLSSDKPSITIPANIHRVGATNAADGGLDMWSSFGMAVQIKHISLDEDKAKEIVQSVTADRIVIVCQEAERKVILSLLNQIGWKSRIQGVVTEKELVNWYERALRGNFSDSLGKKIINTIVAQIQKEFPSTNDSFVPFWNSRGYSDDLIPTDWK